MIQCIQNGEEYVVTVNGQEILVRNVDAAFVEAECNLDDLADETGVDFPPRLNIDVQIENEFDACPFRRVALYKFADPLVEGSNKPLLRETDEPLVLEFECDDSDAYWETGSLMLAAIEKQARYHDQFRVNGDDNTLCITTVIDPALPLVESIVEAVAGLGELIRDATTFLSGIVWKREYEEDQGLFCTGALAPLLKRMGFVAVRYTEELRKAGKNFTFSEWSPFGHLRHYGLLARAADVSGEDDATIDEIIGQVNDAFSTPYCEGDEHDPRYISTVVIAISGKFTENAKEQIAEKIPKTLIGSVVFVDRERIIECIEEYWLKRE